MNNGKIRRYDSKLNAISHLVDSIIIVFTFMVCMHLFGVEWRSEYVWLLLFAIALFNFFAESQDAYRSWRGTQLRQQIYTVLFAWVAGIMILILVGVYWLKQPLYVDVAIALWIIVTPIELMFWHVFVRVILRLIRTKGFNTRQVVIVGATTLGFRLEKIFLRMDWSGFRFAGYYDDRGDQSSERRLTGKMINVIGNFEQLITDCKSGKIDAVYLALPMSAENRIKVLTEKLADTTASVYLVPDLFTFNLLNSRWIDFQGITAISIYDTPFAGINSFIKRSEDVIVSVLILCLVAIPMVLIAIGIKLTSKGPVFFIQSRYGVDGAVIKVWKFRSMTVTDDGDNIPQATRDDKRITPFGGFLRRTSLDELPQFFNSLFGSMSIVGPRPHASAHNEEYRSQIQGYMLRHKVRPGITGLAQINGYRGETDTLVKMQGRLYYDLQYIQTWSLILDMKIIFLTIFKGFVHKNAY